MALPRTPDVEAALAEVADEVGLPAHYRDCVRPLLGVGADRWPRCCGGNCEPCAQTLIRVAQGVHRRLGVVVSEDPD